MIVWLDLPGLAVQNDNAQAIFLFGDLSYADDYNGHNTGQRNGYQPRWDTWGQMMQPIISHLPFISLMGNLHSPLPFAYYLLCVAPQSVYSWLTAYCFVAQISLPSAHLATAFRA